MATELVRKSASATNGGELDSSTTQVIPGTKTFSGAVTVSGALTASSGVVGRTDGATVPSGYIGQVISSTVSAVAAAASNTYGNVTSITLTPGVWHIHGTLITNRSGATITAGNQNAQYSLITSSTPGAGSVRGKDFYPMNAAFDISYSDITWPVNGYSVNISVSTTYYLHAQNKYSAGTPTWDAYLEAVRIA